LISGEVKSSPGDYSYIFSQGKIDFFALKGEESSALRFLSGECCKSDFDNDTSLAISDSMDWVREAVGSNADVSYEILLVPDNVSYKYKTRNFFSKSAPKVRFGFPYSASAEVQDLRASLAVILRVLSHETVHVFALTDDIKFNNLLSEEVFAELAGVCSEAKFLDSESLPVMSILPPEVFIQKVSSASHSDRLPLLKRLDINGAAYTLVEIILRDVAESSSAISSTPNEVLIAYCERTLQRPHDYVKFEPRDIFE